MPLIPEIQMASPPQIQTTQNGGQIMMFRTACVGFHLIAQPGCGLRQLNVYGCLDSGAAWDTNTSCPGGNPHTYHFSASHLHSLSKNNLVWYWDDNVEFTGKTQEKGFRALWHSDHPWQHADFQ